MGAGEGGIEQNTEKNEGFEGGKSLVTLRAARRPPWLPSDGERRLKEGGGLSDMDTFGFILPVMRPGDDFPLESGQDLLGVLKSAETCACRCWNQGSQLSGCAPTRGREGGSLARDGAGIRKEEVARLLLEGLAYVGWRKESHQGLARGSSS